MSARSSGFTLLAPEIVEAILDGRQPAELQLDDLLEAFPLQWEEQKKALLMRSEESCAASSRPSCPPMLRGDATDALVGPDTNRNPS
jgi:hypothetical protein